MLLSSVWTTVSSVLWCWEELVESAWICSVLLKMDSFLLDVFWNILYLLDCWIPLMLIWWYIPFHSLNLFWMVMLDCGEKLPGKGTEILQEDILKKNFRFKVKGHNSFRLLWAWGGMRKLDWEIWCPSWNDGV